VCEQDHLSGGGGGGGGKRKKDRFGVVTFFRVGKVR
jgi:hypothetical protein